MDASQEISFSIEIEISFARKLMQVSFCHLINPFLAKPGSEHAIASAITYASLRAAKEKADDKQVAVEVQAAIFKGDESSVQLPATIGGYLQRSVLDLKKLHPPRPLPLIADILKIGYEICNATHLVFTNMDIAVQENFYVELKRVIEEDVSIGQPFIVYRRNIPERFNDPSQLAQMYAETGQMAYGFDCFVIPAQLLGRLDLGECCIGAAHFDYLLFMALDAVSESGIRKISKPALTFHIGNAIEWSGDIDYIEHNLQESMKSIRTMKSKYSIRADSEFERLYSRHFQPNDRIDSRLLRKLKRIPWVNEAVLEVKRRMGRSH